MLRYLALGDSYTIGEAVPESERWPVQLAARLRRAGCEVADPVIIAQTGWTTDELDAGIDRAGPQGPFDLVSLLIGVNNQYRGRGLDEYRAQFAALLDRAIGFAGGNPRRVLVLSIPDWGVTPFAAGRNRAEIALAIDEFNRANAAEAARRGAHYLDITPASRRAADDPTLLAADGLHPSGKMYAEWVEMVEDVALAALPHPIKEAMSLITHYTSHTGARPDKFFKATLFESARMLLGLNCLEPGQTQAAHTHADQDKFYYVIEGEGVFTLGDETQAAGPGSTVWAPAGVAHGVSNQGSTRLVLLVGIAPWQA